MTHEWMSVAVFQLNSFAKTGLDLACGQVVCHPLIEMLTNRSLVDIFPGYPFCSPLRWWINEDLIQQPETFLMLGFSWVNNVSVNCECSISVMLPFFFLFLGGKLHIFWFTWRLNPNGCTLNCQRLTEFHFPFLSLNLLTLKRFCSVKDHLQIV